MQPHIVLFKKIELVLHTVRERRVLKKTNFATLPIGIASSKSSKDMSEYFAN